MIAQSRQQRLPFLCYRVLVNGLSAPLQERLGRASVPAERYPWHPARITGRQEALGGDRSQLDDTTAQLQLGAAGAAAQRDDFGCPQASLRPQDEGDDLGQFAAVQEDEQRVARQLLLEAALRVAGDLDHERRRAG